MTDEEIKILHRDVGFRFLRFWIFVGIKNVLLGKPNNEVVAMDKAEGWAKHVCEIGYQRGFLTLEEKKEWFENEKFSYKYSGY